MGLTPRAFIAMKLGAVNLHLEQRRRDNVYIEHRKRYEKQQQDSAKARLLTTGLDDFWQLDEMIINQILLQFMAGHKLVLEDEEIIGIILPD